HDVRSHHAGGDEVVLGLVVVAGDQLGAVVSQDLVVDGSIDDTTEAEVGLGAVISVAQGVLDEQVRHFDFDVTLVRGQRDGAVDRFHRFGLGAHGVVHTDGDGQVIGQVLVVVGLGGVRGGVVGAETASCPLRGGIRLVGHHLQQVGRPYADGTY